MLSRVADAIYWMNRYLERAENYARFIDVNYNLSLEMPPDISEQWKPVVVTTGDWDLFESMYKTVDKKRVIYFLGFDPKNPSSVHSSISKARENARAIRPEITTEVWEQINALYYLVKKGYSSKQWQRKDPRNFFDEIKKGCQLLYGIFDATISRRDSWHFGKIGQLIERADKTSRVLDVKYHILLPSPEVVGSPVDLLQWAAMLKSVGAYDMYRKKYGKLMALNISEFLILDRAFPRSMLHCLIQAENSLSMITGTKHGYANQAERHLGSLRSRLLYDDINDIFSSGLHEYLDTFQKDLNNVSTTIFESFFSMENLVSKQAQA